MSDNRSSPRRTVSSQATLRSGQAQINCVVIDVSATGARLRLGAGGFLSNDCSIASTLFRDMVPSRIVWRRGADVGVRFKVAPVWVAELGAVRGKLSRPVMVGAWRRRV